MADKPEVKTEVWEIQIPGTIYARVKNPEIVGTWKSIRANGTHGPKKLTLTNEERSYNQSLIPEENKYLDPFTNGSLRCISGDPGITSAHWLTDTDLAEILKLDSDALFEETVSAIELELTLRRLLDLAERKATVPRFEFVRNLVQERYAVGGTQRAVQEMIDAGQQLSGFRMS